MRIGLQIPSFSWAGSPASIRGKLSEIARTAEDAGFASVWVMDHFFQIPPVGPAEQEMLEGYSTLSYLAGVTERVKLGTLVTGVTYRHPGVLAKTVTTLDVLSGGRAYLGIGAAWFDREHHGLGVPFPALRERFERLEEALRIVKQFWSGKPTPFEGTHYHLSETLGSPPPLTRPHPPILIGGMGEKKTLRLVARYADACNLFAFVGAAALGQKLDVLRRHCELERRPYEEIEKTTLGTANLAKHSPKDLVAQLRELGRLGIGHAIFNFPNVDALTSLATFGKEVIPAVAEL
ncbi:MAG TPA: LLM class F420-dependent oxidoreductase [Myxococcota bacterium]|nr:LLM class F420-dependent oxidoreductase [Myxococcota bacterium]